MGIARIFLLEKIPSSPTTTCSAVHHLVLAFPLFICASVYLYFYLKCHRKGYSQDSSHVLNEIKWNSHTDHYQHYGPIKIVWVH